MSKEHLEIHYWFDDQSHSMEAAVYNTCSKQIVIIFEEIAKILDIKIDVEIEGAKEGGVKEFFSVVYKGMNQTLPSAIIASLLIYIITKDPQDARLKDLQIQNLYLDNKIKEEQLKQIEAKKEISDAVSIFYENGQRCSKIREIEYSPFDQNKILLKEKVRSVPKKDFSKFIVLKAEKEETEIDSDAVIKVISPVIQQTKNQNGIQWVGLYQDKQIWFSMADKGFQRDVINEKYKLSDIKAITSVLEITYKKNADGEKIINSEKYRVVQVRDLNDQRINFDEFRPRTSKKSKVEKDAEQTDFFKK